MPEGPEVESVRQELLQLLNKSVKITLTSLSQKYPKYQNKQEELSQFDNQKIQEIIRFNKFLIWKFEGEVVILNHLGMTGRWLVLDSLDELEVTITHPKVIIQMESPPHAVFDDSRNFGQFRTFPSLEAVKHYRPIRTLGIDGLKDPFPTNRFSNMLDEKRFQNRPLGELLMDPRLVSGIGNIYKAEILFEAKLNPERIISSLSDLEKANLGKSIPKILLKALNDKGSSFDARYVLPSGDTGQAQRWHKVYQRRDKLCTRCETPIQRIVQKKRSTYFCPKCQI
ncbi:MAG: Fpg/Nei family DNA glycosylase [Candidatus Heimdallarchaeota archaeon]|nr:Fpg/Nei family DNA glycosylase [Candidatus Heimdallarchaeota archaeon]